MFYFWHFKPIPLGKIFSQKICLRIFFLFFEGLVQCSTVKLSSVLRNDMKCLQFSALAFNVVWCNVLQCGAVQYSAVHCSAVHCTAVSTVL